VKTLWQNLESVQMMSSFLLKLTFQPTTFISYFTHSRLLLVGPE